MTHVNLYLLFFLILTINQIFYIPSFPKPIMLFAKKKKMIDVRELQRRGVVRIPKQDIVVPTDREGFVEFGAEAKPVAQMQEVSSSSSAMDFLGSSSAAAVPSAASGRMESERITELDNKIYKLEQRIELLEKKLDVNQPSEPNLGVMGW